MWSDEYIYVCSLYEDASILRLCDEAADVAHYLDDLALPSHCIGHGIFYEPIVKVVDPLYKVWTLCI